MFFTDHNYMTYKTFKCFLSLSKPHWWAFALALRLFNTIKDHSRNKDLIVVKLTKMQTVDFVLLSILGLLLSFPGTT